MRALTTVEPAPAGPPPRAHTSPPRRTRALGPLVLGLVALFGVLNLQRALAGDQALFLWTARAMHDGAVLYRDIWDAKQPGIYLFYWASGALFGFDEVGVHLGELVVLLAFAVVLQRTLPDLGFGPRAAAVAPLLTIVPYQLFGGSWDLTQIEPLIGFPLYVALWSSVQAGRSPERAWRRQAVAGVAIGIVGMCKLLYVPLGLVFLLFSLRGTPRGRAVAAWAAGFGVVWLPIVVWVLARGLFHEVWYTWIAFPRISRQQGAQPLTTLTSNARSFGRSIAPVLVPALYGLAVHRRTRPRWLDMVVGWIALALALDLAQFWWRYLYWNLGVPIGLLGLAGLERAVRLARTGDPVVRQRLRAGTALVVVLLGLAVWPERERLARAAVAPIVADGARELKAGEQPLYEDLDVTLAVVRAPGALPGPIVVFGNPIVQLESGRAQSGRFPGFLANTLGPGEWERMARELRADPPAYVFIGYVQERDEQEYLDTRGRAVQALLDESYCEAATVPAGRWLVRCR